MTVFIKWKLTCRGSLKDRCSIIADMPSVGTVNRDPVRYFLCLYMHIQYDLLQLENTINCKLV